ncbi:LysR family transcriptional regulator [Actinokineospora sp.]|uniref:LysR family transcriptional regulator n=1 Tax=Actinokineospora sp. TaxID=1872133 RepID=UPI004037B4A1
MDERVLRAFLVTADLGRMDLAALKLGYAQPTVSYQIRSLEHDLGVRLFLRSCNGMRLTSAGLSVLPSVRAVLLLLDNIRVSARPAENARKQPAG